MRMEEERFRSFSSLNCDQQGEFSRLICSRTQTEAAVCETKHPLSDSVQCCKEHKLTLKVEIL